jgi:hypothetical protein
LSFQSFHAKFEVILKIKKSRNCPLFVSNSNFKIQAKFEKDQSTKVVDLEIWSFSTSSEILGEKEERRG